MGNGLNPVIRDLSMNIFVKEVAVKSRNYESQNNAKSWKHNRMLDHSVMEISIEKSHYNDKSRYYDGFSADWGLSKL